MGDGTQEFKAVPFFLQGIGLGISRTEQLDPAGAQFNLLPPGRRGDKNAGHLNAAACAQSPHNLVISVKTRLCHHLQSGQAGTVSHLYEGKAS
jgi:hypothetical protein